LGKIRRRRIRGNRTLGSHGTPSGLLYRLGEDMDGGIYIGRSFERNFEVYLGV
jgi:hypothetical protein